MVLFSPILPVYALFMKSYSNFKLLTSSKDRENRKDQLKRLTKVSNQAHLIEVCLESSLQPIVQLFSIYAGLREAYSSHELTKTFTSVLEQDWSTLGTVYILGQ